ncbi:aspartyl-phosphate phosphatase Spo0E family protein [Bacillus mesophilus]|uniref:Aspartyl-phosphate phosphatase Spo0E family protein n=2 Tax=Bacillus mesophilus TaxID=1808955 RepID=A0A6M0QET5_9BACI|nr:aspartyl-phosphate phosphatase Spo0E family protein [Bacillus mesophilus]
MKTMSKETMYIASIEKSRKELLELASKSALSSPEVVKASVTLDTILNNYEEYKKQ